MSNQVKPSAVDADPWDTGELGRSLEHAQLVEDEQAETAIDQALNLQLISIRLEKGLIDAFKMIASRNKNIGYQTLMRQSLKRFAVAEIKRIANEMDAEVKAAEKAQKEAVEAQKKMKVA